MLVSILTAARSSSSRHQVVIRLSGSRKLSYHSSKGEDLVDNKCPLTPPSTTDPTDLEHRKRTNSSIPEARKRMDMGRVTSSYTTRTGNMIRRMTAVMLSSGDVKHVSESG
jgi:hypothetical protein